MSRAKPPHTLKSMVLKIGQKTGKSKIADQCQKHHRPIPDHWSFSSLLKKNLLCSCQYCSVSPGEFKLTACHGHKRPAYPASFWSLFIVVLMPSH